MKTPLFIITLLLLAQLTPAQNLPEEFTNLMARAKMTFISPDGYTEAELIENSHMLYEYALKHNDEKFEIRYAIRPVDELLASYNEKESDKKEGDVNIHPDSMYEAIVMAVSFNISGEMQEMGPFDEGAVKAEFNADKGLTSKPMEPREAFSGGYKYCMMVSIYKNGLGTAMYFYMFDDMNVFMKLAMPVFYTLKFK